MTAALWPALLAGAAVAVAVGLPRTGTVRLGEVLARRGPQAAGAADRVSPRALAAAAAGVLAVLAVLGPVSPVALLLAVAAGVLARVLLVRRRRASARALERLRAAEACAALAAELRAGRAPAEALTISAGLARGPAQEALRAGAASARLGGDVPAALRGPAGAGTHAPEVLRGLAACWQVSARSGSGLAAAVDRLAEGLGAQQLQEQAVQAALAGPRASAGLLALLPLAGVALAAGMGARPTHVLLHTPLGLGCLAGGVALDALGLWWTGRLVDRAARVR